MIENHKDHDNSQMKEQGDEEKESHQLLDSCVGLNNVEWIMQQN